MFCLFYLFGCVYAQTPNDIVDVLLDQADLPGDVNQDGVVDAADLVAAGQETQLPEELEDIREFSGELDTMLNGLALEFPEEQLLGTVTQEFQDSGIFTDVVVNSERQMVTGTTSEGFRHFFINNYQPSTEDDVRPSSSTLLKRSAKSDRRVPFPSFDPTFTEIPTSNRAGIFRAFGTGWFDDQEATRITTALESRGYEMVSDQNATVENLLKCTDIGVFFISCHSGYEAGVATPLEPNPPDDFVMVTSTPYNSDTGVQYLDDFLNRRMFVSTCSFSINENGRKQYRTSIAISQRFVEEYITMSENPLVFVSGCYSLNQAIVNGFFPPVEEGGPGEGLFFGFDDSIADYAAAQSAVHLFSRLTGSFDYETPWDEEVEALDFPLRPFTADLIFDEMQRRSLSNDHAIYEDGDGAQLRMVDDTRTDVDAKPGGLVPIVRSAKLRYAADPDDQFITVYGRFAKEGQDDATVTLNGVEATVRSWDPNIITLEGTDKPTGPIVVTINGIESNPLPFSRYDATIEVGPTDDFGIIPTDFSFNPGPALDNPAPTYSHTINLQFHMQPTPYRLRPDANPEYSYRHYAEEDAEVPWQDYRQGLFEQHPYFDVDFGVPGATVPDWITDLDSDSNGIASVQIAYDGGTRMEGDQEVECPDYLVVGNPSFTGTLPGETPDSGLAMSGSVQRYNNEEADEFTAKDFMAITTGVPFQITTAGGCDDEEVEFRVFYTVSEYRLPLERTGEIPGGFADTAFGSYSWDPVRPYPAPDLDAGY